MNLPFQRSSVATFNSEKDMTSIAEHKLNVIRQIDELTEESLCEVEKLIAQLKINQETKKFNPKQFFAVSRLKAVDKQLEEMRNEWER